MVLLLALGCIPELVAPILADNPDHDFDGDGVTESEGDCDDLRDAVAPNRAERCDGFDNDCDELIDGATAIDRATWFADADGDGFGSTVQAQKSCEQPEGFVVDSSDCDDTNAAINPDSVWYADADGDGFGNGDVSYAQCHPPNGFVDNALDCDDTDSNSTPAAVWYADTDGDGLGDPDSSVAQCSAPANHVANGDDCDDTDASAGDANAVWYADVDADGYGDAASSQTACTAPANHVANNEDCDDGDGTFTPFTVWYTDADSDGFGDLNDSLVQCADPGGSSLIPGDCDESNQDVHPNAPEICGNGIDDDCSGADLYCLTSQLAADASWATFTISSAGAELGFAGAATPTHAALAAPGEGSEAGTTYWLAAPAASGAVDVDSAAIVSLIGASPGDRSGEGLVLHGSGLVVGAPDVGNAGAAYIWTDLATSGDFSLAASPAILDGETQAQAGAALLSVDLDAEGTPDIVVGGPGVQGGRGVVYATLAPYSATRTLADETDRLLGTAGDAAGTAFSNAADATGDGSANDFAVAAPGNDRAYLLTPPFSGTDLAAQAGTTFTTAAGGAPASVVLVDVDGDTELDAVVGAPGLDTVHLVLGPLDALGVIDLSAADDVTFTGPAGSGAGESIGLVDDLDGDSLPELLVGAPSAGASGQEGGSAYLVHSGDLTVDGALDALATELSSATPGDDLGWFTGMGPAIDDAPADLLIGAPGANAVYLIRGGPPP